MRQFTLLCVLASAVGLVSAACPMLTGEMSAGNHANPHLHAKRGDGGDASAETEKFLSEFYLNDTDAYLTTDVGGPISDQNSLKAGIRGPTLLEDFIFRQKIQRFDHERVPERAVHARGAGAHGVFTSYADWSNITAASFLSEAGKETPTFARFSTVAGSRGSVDTARDVHGFAIRFYTDEGNYDIVGNNIPVFFIQDAILFPDLIHAVKPQPANEIPQAATAHDTAYDFFGQQPSTLHTLFWAMAGHGIPRSFRHVDGFGVHTYRFVKEDGSSQLVKFHWTSMQGRASLVWEEAQATAGKNADFMRQDLYDSIEAGHFPEWELGVQIIDEAYVLDYGFDLLDPTKILPVEEVPITPLGKLQLNRNPLNYFAETEQVMFQPGHIVRGIDFTDDPLLQGRIFSYLDTQLNRNGGPNFEQIPINRPRIPFHNNNRDGSSQMFIPLNEAAYSPNALNNGNPKQANETVGNGFFTTPARSADGRLVRATSPTFADVWSQPGLFYNSLTVTEQQFVINALRFELSNVKSEVVKSNFITQVNRVNNTLATLVASAIGIAAPEPDPRYYHSNKTSNVGTFGTPLKKIDGLKVGVLASTNDENSISQGQQLSQDLARLNVDTVIVAEHLTCEVSATYSGSDATNFDAVIVTTGEESLFGPQTFTTESNTTFYPNGRPTQILVDAFRFGKPVAAIGNASTVLSAVDIETSRSGVIVSSDVDDDFVHQLAEDLATFKFLDRFAVDH